MALTPDTTVFDEGLFRESPVLAQAEADATMAILTDSHPPVNLQEQPLRYITQSLWYRFREVRCSSPSVLKVLSSTRFLNAVAD